MVDNDTKDLFPNATSAHEKPPPAPITQTGPIQQNCPIVPPSTDVNRSTNDPKSPSYAAAASKSPPATIATAITAASTVSSFKTPSQCSQSSVPDSLSGRTLNTRPKRNVDRDGIANFLQLSINPSREKNVTPESHTYKGIVEIFVTLQKVDKAVAFYPIYESEPGKTPVTPITEASQFQSDLMMLSR
jgi:hypothetical protein